LESYENFNLNTEIGINVFRKKGSTKEDVIFINPYRKIKLDENQYLEVSETELA